MAQFWFIRHGQTDYSEEGTRIFQQAGVNLVPLSAAGVAQVEAAARDVRLQGAQCILCSPYTRAVQTAAILSRALDAPIHIETDLHEWLADAQTMRWLPDAQAERCYDAYMACGGEPPAEQPCAWETAGAMRARVRAVLARYDALERVVVVGHGMMMQATLRLAALLANAEIVGYTL